MENSSRFIYLSGLSGVAAGIIALAGAWYAQSVIFKDVSASSNGLLVLDNSEYSRFSSQLWLLAAAVFIVAFLLAYFFTWRKVTKQGVSIWNYSSRRLFWNMVLPLIAGGLFIYGMIQNGVWAFVAPACLIFYGLDWLAFAHFILAILFIGPYNDPVRNKWVIQFGIWACILVIPFALVAGYYRGIPFFWRFADCSFGFLGLIPLSIIYQKINQLELIILKNKEYETTI